MHTTLCSHALFVTARWQSAEASVLLPAGRMLIAQGAVDACKIGVTIAVKYAAQRPQFGGKIILEYLTHQRRLFPALATTYAMHIALTRLKVCWLSLHVCSDY